MRTRLVGVLLVAAIAVACTDGGDSDPPRLAPKRRTTTSTVAPAPAPSTTTTAPATSGVGPVATPCTGISVTASMNVQAAIDTAPSGASLCFQPGTYRLTRYVIPKSGQRLIAQPGTVLNGSRLVSPVADGTRWKITGQTQQSSPLPNRCNTDAYTGCRHPEGLWVNDVAQWQVTSLAELGPGKFFFDYPADTIWMGTDPTGKRVEASVATAAIRGYGGSTGQQNVVVRGFTVEKFSADHSTYTDGAVQAGWGWTIEHNTIRLNATAGIASNNGGVIRNNLVSSNGQYGIIGGPLTGLTLQGNEIAYNNTSGFHENDDAGGSKWIRSKQMTFVGNYVHHNKGHGLWPDWENYDVTFDGNRLERNTGGGIFFEASTKAVIRNNTFVGNGTQAAGRSLWASADLILNDSKDVEVVGNTITAGVHGITLTDTERGSTLYGLAEIRNVRVYGNTIWLPAGGQIGMVGDRPANFTRANASFDANTYIVPVAGCSCWLWSTARTWSAWRGLGLDVAGRLNP